MDFIGSAVPKESPKYEFIWVILFLYDFTFIYFI